MGLGFVVNPAHIEVVLPTYNGVMYLEAQLASIDAQTLRPLRVILRDDGSSDGTPELIKRLQCRYGSWLHVLPTKGNLGCTANVNRLLEGTTAPYVALADQDDLWLPKKLEQSLVLIQAMEDLYGSSMPLLVHSDLELMDESGEPMGLNYLNRQCLDPERTAPADLTLTNVVTGCSAIMNRPLLQRALPIPPQAAMHDWWLALVASVFGRIKLLPQATVRYRQHSHNVLGSHGLGPGYWWKRFQLFIAKPAVAGTLRIALNQTQAFQDRYFEFPTALPTLMQLPRRRRWLMLCQLPAAQRPRKHGPLRSFILVVFLLALPE